MITFNGIEPPQQPSRLNENPSQVKSDTYAIDGTPSRMQLPSKGRARLSYDMAKPETYHFFKTLYDAAMPVVYKNTDSNTPGGILEFSGIIDISQGDYIRGGSLMVPLEVSMMQGNVND